MAGTPPDRRVIVGTRREARAALEEDKAETRLVRHTPSLTATPSRDLKGLPKGKDKGKGKSKGRQAW